MGNWLLSLLGKARKSRPATDRERPLTSINSAPQRHCPQADADTTTLSAIIHGLSQPLTALRGALELALLAEHSAEEYRLVLKESLAQADRLVGLLRSLRELAECETPNGLTSPVELDRVIRDLVDELRPLADSNGVSLTLELVPRLRVFCDPGRLRESIFRVIHQAVERTPRGGTVRILTSKTNDRVSLLVADEGPPARPDDLSHLEHPPSLGHLFSEASRRGTLEWAVAKRILEAQRATVRVESSPDQGCSFRVCFP